MKRNFKDGDEPVVHIVHAIKASGYAWIAPVKLVKDSFAATFIVPATVRNIRKTTTYINTMG